MQDGSPIINPRGKRVHLGINRLYHLCGNFFGTLPNIESGMNLIHGTIAI